MALDYTKLLRKLTPETQIGGDPGLQLRTGTVTALAANGTATVTLNGGSVPNVPVLAQVGLVVGAVVQMLSQRGSLLIIGVVNSTKRVAISSGDQNSPTNAATTAATGLSFEGAANATYLVDAFLSYAAPAAADIKFSWTGPSGFGMARYILAPTAGMSDNQNTAMAAIRRSPGTNQTAGATGAGVASEFTDYQEKTLCRIGSTAGTVQLQFGQVTANGTPATLHGDSFLVIERVG